MAICQSRLSRECVCVSVGTAEPRHRSARATTEASLPHSSRRGSSTPRPRVSQPTDAVASAVVDFQARVDARRALLDDDHDAKERYRAWKGSDRAADIVAGSAAALAALEAEFEDDVAIW